MRRFRLLSAILLGLCGTQVSQASLVRAPAETPISLDTSQIISAPQCDSSALAGRCGRPGHSWGGAYYQGYRGGYGGGWSVNYGAYYPAAYPAHVYRHRVHYPVGPVYRPAYYRWGCY